MLRWSSTYLGQEQTQALPSSPSQQVYHPLSLASKSHYRAPHCPGRRGSSPGRRRPAPGLPQAPAFPSGRSLRPGRAPRTLLFTSMVPRQPLPAPCRWLRFMLRPGPAAASSSRAAPRERGERVRGQRALDVAAAREPPHRHLQIDGCGSGLRAEVCSAGS